jgi:hypothetical protein
MSTTAGSANERGIDMIVVYVPVALALAALAGPASATTA